MMHCTLPAITFKNVIHCNALQLHTCITPCLLSISLTCISCKIMEHIVTKHIINHLEKKQYFMTYSGSRQHRSCETQLISFVQELAANNNNNTQTYLIIIDFTNAFDKVPHKRLLYKLNYYGIHIYGVPQGTVLGPVLFLAYIMTCQNTYRTESSDCLPMTVSSINR